MTVRWLSAVGLGDIASVGGKGANLGELIFAGMPVPTGFVVDVDSCNVLRDGAFPPELEHDIIDALREIGGDENTPVAVRSSGVAEDGADASYAGINETFHGVRGVAGVLKAVRGCCESANTSRAAEYTEIRAKREGGVGFAVVVQRQIASAIAGVAFSVDPSAGNPGRIVIEAARGHGESVVSGSVTPDRVLVDKATLAVTSSTPGDQRVALEPSDNGLAERKLSEAEIGSVALSGRQIEVLARCVLWIEQHGGPQDVEWAFNESGALWILQAPHHHHQGRHHRGRLRPARPRQARDGPVDPGETASGARVS